MLIDCPNCATTYDVADDAIGAAGRSVRCARCRNVWFAVPSAEPAGGTANGPEAASDAAVAAFRTELGGEPPPSSPASAPVDAPTADEPEPAAAPAADASINEQPVTDLAATGSALPVTDIETAAAAATEAENALSLANEAPEAAATDDAAPSGVESQAAAPAAETIDAPALRRRRPRRPPPVEKPSDRRLIAAIFAMLTIVGALLVGRTEIVRQAPQMASLYAAIGLPVNLRKLYFTDVRLGKEVHDGVPVLTVEGTIVSTSSTPLDVPRLRLSVRNVDGAEIYAWTALPSQTKIGPYEALPFRSRLASPPAEGREILVRFFTRRDALASLQ